MKTKTGNALLRIALLGSLTFTNAATPGWTAADCAFPPDGRVTGIAVQSCQEIDGRTNEDVLKYAGSLQKEPTIQKLYTGALVTADHGTKWMYPSAKAHPCQKFPKSAQVTMRAYLTCCDSGPWGKCVFGGNWLGDVDGQPINAFQ